MFDWFAFDSGGRVIGTVKGRTLEQARLEAFGRWGSDVDQVRSKASVEIDKLESHGKRRRRFRDEEEE